MPHVPLPPTPPSPLPTGSPSGPCVLVETATRNVLSAHPDLASAVSAARMLAAVRHFAGLPRLGTEIRPLASEGTC